MKVLGGWTGLARWMAAVGAAALLAAGCSAKPKSPDLEYEPACASECRESYKGCVAAKRQACGYTEQQCLRTCASWLKYPDGRKVDIE